MVFPFISSMYDHDPNGGEHEHEHKDGDDLTLHHRNYATRHPITSATANQKGGMRKKAATNNDSNNNAPATNHAAFGATPLASSVAMDQPRRMAVHKKIDNPSIIVDGDDDATTSSMDHFQVVLDIPGYNPSDITITIEEDSCSERLRGSAQGTILLTIKGRRSNRLFHASFQKTFRLEESYFDFDRVDAIMEDGCGLMTVTIPRKKQPTVFMRTVAVRSNQNGKDEVVDGTGQHSSTSKSSNSGDDGQDAESTSLASPSPKSNGKAQKAEKASVETVDDEDNDKE